MDWTCIAAVAGSTVVGFVFGAVACLWVVSDELNRGGEDKHK